MPPAGVDARRADGSGTLAGVQLTGRSVLLTGASGGLGAAIARELRAAGAELVLTARRMELVEPLAAELGGIAERADLLDRDDVARLADAHPDVDVVVHNAAMPASGRLEEFTTAELDRALEVNLRAPLVLTRLLGERMLARGSGHVVFVSSMSGKVATSGSCVYSATKFGLRGAAQGLRTDWGPHGIGVSVVSPSFVRDAGMFHDAGVRLPRYVRTVSPGQVGQAVRRAVERDTEDIDVAPVALRVSALLNAASPGLVRALGRWLGSDDVARDFARGQSHRR